MTLLATKLPPFAAYPNAPFTGRVDVVSRTAFLVRRGHRAWLGVLLAALGTGGCSIVPSHEIPVHEAYIHAGVQAGDKLEVTTEDGRKRKLVVTAVGRDSLSGPDEVIHFADIRKLVKYSWSTPRHPCGGGLPVGCSAPVLKTIAAFSESEKVYDAPDELEPACIAHDYCYRHGFATYGVSRKECDDAFYGAMKELCYGPLHLNVLDLKDFSLCMLAAAEINHLVRELGEDAFLQEDSTYCEYDLARTPLAPPSTPAASPAAGGVETHVVGSALEDRPVGPGTEADH